MFKLSDLKNPHTPVMINTPNIFWDEVLQNNLYARGYSEKDFNSITSPTVMLNIIQHCMMQQEYRDKTGRSLDITSMYRPDLYNDVVMIDHHYKASRDSDHKFYNSGASDTKEKAYKSNMDIWKDICIKWEVSWSIGMYGSKTDLRATWLHLGWRRNEKTRLWDWRK